MKNRCVAVVSAILIAGCATPYGKSGLTGGYTDTQIDSNTFTVSVDTNGFTSQQTTSLHALYRAAELTIERGYDYFVIVGQGANATQTAVSIPGTSTSNTTIHGTGQSAYARTTTTYAPATIVPMVFPNATVTVKAFKGQKPEGDPNAYDAKEVMKYIGPQIGISGAKAGS